MASYFPSTSSSVTSWSTESSSDARIVRFTTTRDEIIPVPPAVQSSRNGLYPPGQPALNPYLDYSRSPFRFDFRATPKDIAKLTCWNEPATHPPTRAIRVVVKGLPWSCRVSASDGKCVTVYDILTRIIEDLETVVMKEEMQREKAEVRDAVWRNSKQRQAMLGYREPARIILRGDFLAVWSFVGFTAAGVDAEGRLRLELHCARR